MSAVVLAHELPDMPADWLPQFTTVRGWQDVGDRRLTLSFVVTPDMLKYPQLFAYQMESFRRSFWEAIHATEIEDGTPAS